MMEIETPIYTEMRTILLDKLDALLRLFPEFEETIHRSRDNKVRPGSIA